VSPAKAKAPNPDAGSAYASVPAFRPSIPLKAGPVQVVVHLNINADVMKQTPEAVVQYVLMVRALLLQEMKPDNGVEEAA